MKRCFRAMYLFVPIVIFLLGSIGCAGHQYCVDTRKVDVLVPYCCARNSKGACLYYCNRVEERSECAHWECKEGYVRDEKKRHKCITKKEYYEKYPGGRPRTDYFPR